MSRQVHFSLPGIVQTWQQMRRKSSFHLIHAFGPAALTAASVLGGRIVAEKCRELRLLRVEAVGVKIVRAGVGERGVVVDAGEEPTAGQRVEPGAGVAPPDVDALPHGELVAVPDVGHAPVLLEPTAFEALERFLVQPLSNLIVTGQIRETDCIRVTHSPSAPMLTFFREARVFRSWEVQGAAA